MLFYDLIYRILFPIKVHNSVTKLTVKITGITITM